MNAWGGHQLQFVWFTTTNEGLNADDLFRRIWEQEPDQYQVNRVPSPALPFLSLATTQGENQPTRQMTVSPGRVDLAVISAGDPEVPFGRAFDLKSSLAEVLERIESSGCLGQDVLRSSVVATLLHRVATYAEGSKFFFDALGHDLALPDATDLVFQANLKKSVGDRGINRICNFSVAGTQHFQFDVGIAPNLRPPAPVTVISLAARRHFDFNTIPDGRLMDFQQQIHMWRALADEIVRAAEIDSIGGLKG